jgi:transposase
MSLEPHKDTGVPEMTARVVAAAFPHSSPAIRLRDALGPVFTDERFTEAFSRRGRPAVSPGALALISVLQHMEGLTDRQTAEAVRSRMDWKYLLGLELDDPGIAHATLSHFRSRLLEHGLEDQLLEAVLERADQAGLLTAKGRQRTDSTHILACARHLNRMEFVGETLRSALEALAAAAPSWLTPRIEADWAKRYCARIDSWRFPKGEQPREKWLSQVGRDGYALLEEVFSPHSPAWIGQIEAVQVLRRVWVQQFLREEGQVRWREPEDGLPPGRRLIVTPYDTDARVGVKRGERWSGYKVHISEVCEPDAVHLITHVATTDATVEDSEMIEAIHAHLSEADRAPAEHLVDTGYISIDHVVRARTGHKIALTGPMRGDTHHRRDAPGARFCHADFTIDWDGRRVTCPAGKRSATWCEDDKNRSVPVVNVRFTAADCGPCPLRERCTTAKNPKWGRSLTMRHRHQHEELARLRAEQRTQVWKQRYGMRAGVEGTMRQATTTCGNRRSRYQGLARTHLSHMLTGCAINLRRIDARLSGVPVAGTRTGHLATLIARAPATSSARNTHS